MIIVFYCVYFRKYLRMYKYSLGKIFYKDVIFILSSEHPVIEL